MDFNLNEIGYLFNYKKNSIKPEINEFSYLKVPNKNYIKIHSVLICLMNIIKLKDLILDKSVLNIKENMLFLFNFCKISIILKKKLHKICRTYYPNS